MYYTRPVKHIALQSYMMWTSHILIFGGFTAVTIFIAYDSQGIMQNYVQGILYIL